MTETQPLTGARGAQGYAGFDPQNQALFDAHIGRATLAHQENRLAEALDHLSEAERLLTAEQVNDPFDWSGHLDLRMCVQASSSDLPAAAATAARMLSSIDPEPDGYPLRLQEIIQDSLVEAALIRARYLVGDPSRQDSPTELERLLESAMRWCRRLGRDGDEQEFAGMQERHARRGDARPDH
ncbi:MAG: hypothetical protein ACOVKS_02075 [Aquimonas sp.]|jgi:hypothetical protein